jgi:hypothetical protein
MTPDQINIAIAELCGWKRGTKKEASFSNPAITIENECWYQPPNTFPFRRVPDYHSDLNAVHEAETQHGFHNLEYKRLLTWVCDHDWQHATVKTHRNPIFATAPQRCEALLKTVGKWTE